MDIGNELPEMRSKLKNDICILIFTYDNHNQKLITVLKKLNEVDIYKIISFNYKDKLPLKKVYDLSDAVVTTARLFDVSTKSEIELEYETTP